MSKPPLSTDLGNYNTSLSAHIPDIISKKSPSPKGQRVRERKRDRSGSDLSGGKEGQKALRTDQLTPPSRTGSTNSSTSSPPSSPARSLKTLSRNHSKESLSESLLLHSPVHSRARSPSPSFLSYLTPSHQPPKPLQNKGTPTTNNKPSHSSTMSRPKLLRPSPKDLQKIDCVSAETVFKTITDDTFEGHEPADDGPPAIDQVLNTMSDFMINRQEIFCIKMDNKFKQSMVEALKNDKKIKDFFKEEGDQLVDLSDHIRNTVSTCSPTRP